MKQNVDKYTVLIVDYKTMPANGLLDNKIIYVSRLDGVDEGVKFLCPCGCRLPIWLPFGDSNNEGGSGSRTITWHTASEVSISPSILVKGGCNSHFFIRHNKVEPC